MITGKITRISKRAIVGWVVDLTNRKPIELKIFLNQKLIGKTLSSRIEGQNRQSFLFRGDRNLEGIDLFSIKILAGIKNIELDFELNGFESSILFFVHIPKTAGTTFRRMLESKFSTSEIFPNQNDIFKNGGTYPPLRDFKKLSEDRLSSLKLINGHYFSYEYHKLPYNLKKLVFFRNPVDRIVSHLKHIQIYEKGCQNFSIEDIYQNRRTGLINLQIKYVAHHEFHQFLYCKDEEDFRKNIKNILEEFDFIGIQEKMNDSISLLNKTFGWKFTEPKMTNTTKSKEKPTRSLLELIKQDSRMEFWLYKEATTIFEERLKNV